MIFKIQKPLGGNVDPPEILAYNKDRSITLSIPMPAEDIDALFGFDAKQYWEGNLIETGDTRNLELVKKVREQSW